MFFNLNIWENALQFQIIKSNFENYFLGFIIIVYNH